MRIDDFGENAVGGNGLFLGEIWLGGTLNWKWGEMGDHKINWIYCVSFAL